MKNTIRLMVVAAALIGSNYSFGQSTTTGTGSTDVAFSGRPTMSFGVTAAKPIGNLDKTTDFGGGGDIKFAFPVGVNTDITAQASYLYFSRDNSNPAVQHATQLIPFKAGFRYRFGPRSFYLEPQAGYSAAAVGGSGGSQGGFVYAGNIGYFLSNHFDLSLRYEDVIRRGMPNDSRSNPFVGLRLGYNFKL
ncbi:outer membrane beta-barrel protein [Aridibaculum aurantiacum]|uniref:outer membrane beta-barrel protein n=1 Tax=Aridibaculum aurantiacum TaxID=2810307 RepID=UPI001A97984B|nr:outer membrane beta-barrel protein [Aridibaculum aurantiacum]